MAAVSGEAAKPLCIILSSSSPSWDQCNLNISRIITTQPERGATMPATNVDTVNYAKTTQSWQKKSTTLTVTLSRVVVAIGNKRLTERWAFLSCFFFFFDELFLSHSTVCPLIRFIFARSVVIYEWRHRHTNDELINPIGLTSELIRRKKRTAELGLQKQAELPIRLICAQPD